MIAAIYARRSTEQTGVSEDQKSVQRQVEHARAFASAKGWTVAEDHVYVDDAVSGAEFERRPGFLRLMNALKPKPAFQVLVMSEESRLGREMVETMVALKALVVAGVRIFYYMTGKERTIDSPIEKAMMALETFGAEQEREKARQRTYDALLRKARAGHVTGGKTFGYDNLPVFGPDGKRSHVERRVNDVQAAAIVRVFELSAENGLTRTAKQLNAERIVAPGGHGWSPSSVRTILHRRLYLGEGFWNQSQKRDRWGQKRQRPRPASEWERVTAPRIVSDELWNAAHARMATVRVRLTTAQGERPIVRRDVESSYLLSGFARCSVCGGTLAVVSRSHGRQRAYFYGCLAHWKRGTTACTNGLVLPVRVVEDAVLRSMRQDALRPAVVKAILDVVFEALKPAELESTVQGLGAELRTLDQRIARLTMAIEEGGTIAPLVAQLQTRQAERETLVASIAATEARQALVLDRETIEARVLAHVAQWRELLTTGRVADGRQLLREALEEPLRFTPEGRAYRFEGVAAAERLLGKAGLPPLGTSPMPASWNQIVPWLSQLDGLRRAG
ncbi:MAG: hypothetical protein A3H96_09485 [Acidobacteria bacterium RIFCSPLOWO2_02_FULL_67_36]|nr:MAG: hypothetical protein A3H96_09485 [Acidobacteria bacterium RIFCSPLOWO2_02_FULL_67_36]OFW24995.1 MAG: hypothetical protein A3G21_16255 [Acidobacteria bacterium RIFCSPLOWO2_12_FULL_66_21]